MNPTYDFSGQVAVVTGASSGMGLATARAFAGAGAAVILANIDDDRLRAGTEDLTVAGHQALRVTCDASDEDQVADPVERVVATYGRLDMAFNNLHVRSAYGPDNPWYRRAKASAAGRIRAGGLERDASLTNAASDEHAAIDATDHAKYGRYGARYVDPVTSRESHAATLRLVPS